jgi:hypothetical protein
MLGIPQSSADPLFSVKKAINAIAQTVHLLLNSLILKCYRSRAFDAPLSDRGDAGMVRLQLKPKLILWRCVDIG